MNLEQKWPDNLYIIRHGLSRRNVDREAAKKAGGQADFSKGIRDQDTPLVPFGEMQALSVGVELRKRHGALSDGSPMFDGESYNRPINVLYVSPYLRTRQTANKIIEGLGYTPEHVIHDERIREIEFGLLDGLSREGVAAKYPEELRRREREGKYWYRAPGGENRPDVKLRIRSFLDTLVRDCRGLNVAVVCHSVIVLAFRATLEKWQEDDYLMVDKENDVKNASVTHYAFESRSLDELLAKPKLSHSKLRLKEYNAIFYSEEAK